MSRSADDQRLKRPENSSGLSSLAGQGREGPSRPGKASGRGPLRVRLWSWVPGARDTHRETQDTTQERFAEARVQTAP